MGYLDDHESLGPALVPAIPDHPYGEHADGEIGLLWKEVTRSGRAPRQYLLPQPIFNYLTADFRYFMKLGGFGEPASEMDTSVPTDEESRELHRRTLYWTFALMILGHELLNQTVVPPGFPISISVGYFDPLTEANQFGLAIAIDSALLPHEILPPEPTPIYSLPVIRNRQVQLPAIIDWPAPGPFVVRRPHRIVELHRPPSFAGATSASYVRHAATGTPMGLLGCRHVLPTPTVGAAVPMISAPSQAVVAVSNEHVDLAVVSSPTPVPVSPRPIQRWPAQWQPCEIDGEVSPMKAARIAEITNTWGVFSDPLMPVAVDLDDIGAHGDSGAAVLDACTDGPQGICSVYRGAVNNAGPPKGTARHIQQVEKVMKVQLVE